MGACLDVRHQLGHPKWTPCQLYYRSDYRRNSVRSSLFSMCFLWQDSTVNAACSCCCRDLGNVEAAWNKALKHALHARKWRGAHCTVGFELTMQDYMLWLFGRVWRLLIGEHFGNLCLCILTSSLDAKWSKCTCSKHNPPGRAKNRYVPDGSRFWCQLRDFYGIFNPIFIIRLRKEPELACLLTR